MVLLGDVGQVEARFNLFRDSLISTQDSRTVCAKHTIGSKNSLGATDHTPT
jgi:hypothetical protein